MASPDILTLSSSPPRVFRAFHMPLSPALRSPDTFDERNLVGTCNEEDRIAEGRCILGGTRSTITTLLADTLQSAGTGLPLSLQATNSSTVQLKGTKSTKKPSTTKSDSVQFSDKLDGTRTKEASDGTRAKKPRLKKAEGEATDIATGTRKNTRKSQPEKGEGSKGEDGIKEKAVRKPRAKKTAGETQAKLPKAQVTKHSAATDSRSTKPDLVSRHFPAAVVLDKSSEDLSSSGLLEAVKRRTCWTPPKPTVRATTAATNTSGAADGTSSPAAGADLDQSSGGFSNLLSNFGFTGTRAPSENKSAESVGTNKRKLIELVTTSVSASKSEIAAAKSNAPKKKARTITDQATSAYNHDETISAGSVDCLSSVTPKMGFKIPPKPRSKKPAKASSKRGKGTAQAPILLSPESALKQVSNQYFVFGTSSQLAREESPTFLRDIHAAMQASNEIDEFDPFMDCLPATDIASVKVREERVSPAKRNLWNAASRDTSGQLLNVEMVDLSNSPVVANLQAPVGVKTGPALSPDGGVWRDIEELSVESPLPKTTINRKRTLGSSPQAGPQNFSSHSVRESSPSALPTQRLPEAIPRPAQDALTVNPPTAMSEPDKPDYSSYTTVELAKEIASYRFKPVKNRNHMITLLERCWEGKRRTALGSLEANAMVHTSTNSRSKLRADKSGSPKRPIGRPRLASTAASPKASEKKSDSKAGDSVEPSRPSGSAVPSKTTERETKGDREPIDEISDTDTPLTPSPPRRRPSQIRTTPLPLIASTVAEESPVLSPTSSQIRLFEHITRAVTSTPPSKDPSNPSWHEKILLYDPIILEDLTVWLNTGALEKVGWDGEVHPGEVKKWCVSKSICCLWKENLRGEARTRF